MASGWTPRSAVKRIECNRYSGGACCMHYCEIVASTVCCCDCENRSTCAQLFAPYGCPYICDPFPPQDYDPDKPFRIIIPGIPRTKKNNPDVSRGYRKKIIY